MNEETNWVVFDVEADSLTPTKIHCLSWEDHKGDTGTATSYDDIRDFFQRFDVYVGHNIRRWDLPVLQRLCGIRIPERIIDTLGLAWYLDPGRKKNGLETYGEDFGVPKPVILDWENQRLQDYIYRCEQDVQINVRLWKHQSSLLFEIYEDWKEVWRFLKYLDFKMYCLALQEESGWMLDESLCRSSLEEMEEEYDRKKDELRERMPVQPVVRKVSPPSRPYKGDGELSKVGEKWFGLLERKGLPRDHLGPVEEVIGYTEGNPDSHIQVKDWLWSLGWVPQTIKYQRSKTTGEMKEIPQVNKEHGAGICDSVKLLYEKEPALELLDGLGVLSHRISILRGFIRDVIHDGTLTARAAGFTNTLRLKHAELVNLPKPEKPYGDIIRGCLVARTDLELCGSDMSSLEDRLKQHFIHPHDPDYVAELQSDDYDPHLDLAYLAGALTKEDIDDYRSDNHEAVRRVKPIRGIYKNGNYACQYGAGVSRLAITCGCDTDTARVVHETYWKRNWAIKAVADEQTIKTRGEQMWLYNPISRFWYSLRYEKDIFSTLVQGSAVYCFDLWLSLVLQDRPQLTGQFHDEFILEVQKGKREQIEGWLRRKIAKVNDILKLNVKLDIDVQFGARYSEIH